MLLFDPHGSESVEVIDNKPVLMPMQTDLIERGRQACATSRRVIFQAPCGSGKTWCAAKQTVNALEKGKRVLHVVHRRRLVDQMLWTLSKFGITASPFMEGRTRWNSPVTCASRDTLLATLKAGGSLPNADMIVWDEAHVAAKDVQDWYLKNCPQAYWIGYTATPVAPGGASLKPPYQDLVCMAPTSELIRAGRLCNVKVFNPDAVGQRRKKGDKVKPVGDPIDHWKKFALDLPTVGFAAKVTDSQEIVRKYLAAGISAEHIDASTPEDEREAVFERSRTGKTRVLYNVGVLVEGVDLPWLECCQLLRGCYSLVIWIQATGRVMRAFPGKTHGIVLDHSGAAHEFGLPDSDYQWTLDDEAGNKKRNKKSKDERACACPRCGFVFAGKPRCPECGHVRPVKKRKSMLDDMKPGDGILTEFNEAAAESRRAAYHKIFKQCFFTARARGGTMGMAAAMFSDKVGVPPWKAGLSLNLPGPGQWKISAKQWEI